MNKADSENIEDIVRRARMGDPGAFGVLYELYFTPLYRYIYFRVPDKADADDLTQDIFLKVHASFSRYVSSGGSPLAYFYTIARNSIIDHHRKKKTLRAEDGVFDAIPDDAENAEERAVRNEEYEVLRKKIIQLPPDQQDAITLRFIDGLSTQEVASIMRKSEVAVRQIQSRGLKSLRNNFKQNSDIENI
jgi:RNA polymerase sigma-70 factor (ECF subfamily)